MLSLRTDVAYIVSGHAAFPAAPASAAPPARPSLRLAEDPYRCAGMLGLLTAAFVDLDMRFLIAEDALPRPHEMGEDDAVRGGAAGQSPRLTAA